ncbi:MAG: hypothetical protein O7F16_04150, partial [Acidobacteria bacterium]|nr:hypothetical protein [Acidobacteriota bacterium]
MISFESSKRIWIFSIFCVSVLAMQPVYPDPGRGTLYGTNAGDGDTITVNPLTGAGMVVGASGVNATPSLAVDPTTGIIYGGEGSGSPNLYTVSALTGAWTLVGIADPECGNTNLGFAAIGGLDFRADGTLFAAVNIAGDGGTGSDHLAILDKTTGLASVIGPFGSCTGVETECTSASGSCTIEGMEAIAFDEFGVLWGAVNARGAAGSPGLYTIDPTTGAATFVTSILETEESIPDGGIVSLQFECDGTLLGGSSRAFGEAIGGRLGTIDTLTGFFTPVGVVSATGGSSLAALGYDTPCPQRPVCMGAPITDPVGVAGTTTDDDGIATIELDESSTNLVLDVDESFEVGDLTALFTVAPDISGSDAEGSVIVTDVTGLTCQLPVNFMAIPAGPTEDEVICSGEGILLEVSNSLSTEGGGAICSGSEFTDGEPALPPGVDPSPDGDPTLCRVLTITSPISGETVMVYKKDGPFEPRLRLLIAEFDGSEFEDFKDVTESVIAITDIIPDPTRLTGRG